MLKSVFRLFGGRTFPKIRYFSTELCKVDVVETKEIDNCKPPGDIILEKCNEDISHVAPYFRPSFNLAAYVNKSETLQQFLKLGVQIYKWDKNSEIPPFVLGLDFEKDIKNYIIFFTDLGLQTEDLKKLIEKNPFIFKEDLDDLQVRINYLKFKKFEDEMILRIVQENPVWLSHSTQEIDKKLGFFQKHFSLTGNQVRKLATKRPKLITYNLHHIKVNTFAFKEEMGLTHKEVKSMLLEAPKLFMKSQNNILKTFEYLHKEMKIPVETIISSPQVLTCREFKLKQRYKYLEKMRKIQFDPKQPNYISLISLVADSDGHFATEIAGSSVQSFNDFLKTL